MAPSEHRRRICRDPRSHPAALRFRLTPNGPPLLRTQPELCVSIHQSRSSRRRYAALRGMRRGWGGLPDTAFSRPLRRQRAAPMRRSAKPKMPPSESGRGRKPRREREAETPRSSEGSEAQNKSCPFALCPGPLFSPKTSVRDHRSQHPTLRHQIDRPHRPQRQTLLQDRIPLHQAERTPRQRKK